MERDTVAVYAAPDAWFVQGDLEALPFRRGELGGSWARAAYLHVPRERLPAALAQLHDALRVGAPADFTFRHGDVEGALRDGDFPGRFLAEWQPEPLHDVLVGAGFAVEQCELRKPDSGLAPRERASEGSVTRPDASEKIEVVPRADSWIVVRATRARTLADTVGPGMRLLVCGLNPSEYAADVGVGFARPGNRFWPAARGAGVVTCDRDPLRALVRNRVGMTDLVKRATPRADMLTADEYRAGLVRVERLVRWLHPRAVCFVGLAGWRAAVDRRAVAGEQRRGFAGVPTYVMPSTSGANARSSVEELTGHLRAAMALAGGARRA